MNPPHSLMCYIKMLQVVLYDVSGAVLGSQLLGPDHTSHMFFGLIPGRLYRADVVTHSGQLTNNASASGRTCNLITHCSIDSWCLCSFADVHPSLYSSRASHPPVRQTRPSQ